MRIKSVITSVMLSLLAGSSLATTVDIQNSSFENLTGSLTTSTSFGLTIKSTNSINIGAWSTTIGESVAGLGASSVTVGNSASIGCPTPKDGTNSTLINLAAGLGTSVTMTQNFFTAFMPNCAYKLLFDLDPGFNLTLLGQTTLGLQAGSTTVAALSSSSLLGQVTAGNSFQTLELDFTTGATAPTGNIGVMFQQNSVLNLGGSLYVDNARLTFTPVPEPSPLALLGLGVTLLCVINRSRNKTA